MSISEELCEATEKQFKSRKEYLANWRKTNSEKSKEYSRKANQKYYQKNSVKKKLKFKISYHEREITHSVPYLHYCHWCNVWGVYADHKCFHEHHFLPRNLWRVTHDINVDIEQIRINKQFVINLQNQGLMPIFLLHSDTTYVNNVVWREIDREEFKKCYDLMQGDSENEAKYVDEWKKTVDERYTKYLGSVKRD